MLTSVSRRRGEKVTAQAFGLEFFEYMADVFMHITQDLRGIKLAESVDFVAS